VNREAMSRQVRRLCPYTATGLPGEAVVNALHSEEVNSSLANWSVLLRWEQYSIKGGSGCRNSFGPGADWI
jgi:hypothetical protein